MPCPPHPIEIAERRVANTMARAAQRCREWHQAARHAEDLLQHFQNPKGHTWDALRRRLANDPTGPAATPPIRRGKGESLEDYDQRLSTMAVPAAINANRVEEALCELRTLFARLSNAGRMSRALRNAHRFQLKYHRAHREHERRRVLAMLRTLEYRQRQRSLGTKSHERAEVQAELARLRRLSTRELLEDRTCTHTSLLG